MNAHTWPSGTHRAAQKAGAFSPLSLPWCPKPWCASSSMITSHWHSLAQGYSPSKAFWRNQESQHTVKKQTNPHDNSHLLGDLENWSLLFSLQFSFSSYTPPPLYIHKPKFLLTHLKFRHAIVKETLTEVKPRVKSLWNNGEECFA